MNPWMIWITAYLIGSIPCGVIVARIKSVNIREYGSGNIGATNVARTLGKTAGLVTLVGDGLKGVLAVALSDHMFGDPLTVSVTGFTVLVGHIFSVFLKFNGGKGVATGLGVFIYLMPAPVLCSVVLFAIVLGITRYVSAGSIVATLSLPVVSWLFHVSEPLFFCATASSSLIVLKHFPNINRLMSGTESRFFDK